MLFRGLKTGSWVVIGFVIFVSGCNPEDELPAQQTPSDILRANQSPPLAVGAVRRIPASDPEQKPSLRHYLLRIKSNGVALAPEKISFLEVGQHDNDNGIHLSEEQIATLISAQNCPEAVKELMAQSAGEDLALCNIQGSIIDSGPYYVQFKNGVTLRATSAQTDFSHSSLGIVAMTLGN